MQIAIKNLLLVVLCALMGAAEHADEPVHSYHPARVAFATVTGPPRGEDDNVAYYAFMGTEDVRMNECPKLVLV